MHLIRPEYDPVAETVSQYAIGPYGYLMTAGFFSVGVGVVALAIGLSRALPWAPRIGSALLLMATVLQSLDTRTLLRWRSQRHSLG